MPLIKTATIPIQVGGEEYLVDIRPIRKEHLARLGSDLLPSVFAPEGGEADAQAALEFMRLVVVAGVVQVRGPGGPYKLALQADYNQNIIEPEDLEEPGLTGDAAYRNTQKLFQEILTLSGQGELFRTATGEGEVQGGGEASGTASASAG